MTNDPTHQPSEPSRGPRPGESICRLLLAAGYLAGIAWGIGAATAVSFAWTLLALLAGTVFTTTLALVWLTRSAIGEEGRRGQFRLASLLFVTTFAAIYFGAVRWVVVRAAPTVAPENEMGVFAIVGVFCLVAVAVAVPIVFAAADSLVWFAVWLVRRPRVRRWLRARRSPPKPDHEDA